MNHHNCDTSLDKKFRQVEGLPWLPWVGKEYFQRAQRILIVGQTHHASEENGHSFKEVAQKHYDDPNTTRNAVPNCAITGEWFKGPGSLFPMLFPLLSKDPQADKAAVWSKLAFYSFIPRLMNWDEKEQPQSEDFHKAWRPFVDVVRLLRPTGILFAGVAAANSFNHEMNALQKEGLVQYKAVVKYWDRKSSGVIPRRAELLLDEKTIPIAFIKNPSGKPYGFSSDAWKRFLSDEVPEVLLR